MIRVPTDQPERPTGCIDTPYIGGDQRATTSGVSCGRARTPDAVLLRGRVSAEEPGGLPGRGLEDLWVTLHPVEDGPLRLDALPPARAQTKTGPQGAFSIGLTGAKEYVVAVRAEASGPALTARRFVARGDDRTPQLELSVPLDDDLRARLGLSAPPSE